MKLARENRDRPAAVDAATAAADTVAVAKVAAREEGTNEFAKSGSGRAVGRAGFEPAKA